jgi:hypothetical protein
MLLNFTNMRIEADEYNKHPSWVDLCGNYTSERIDGLLTKQIRAGQFETCADPRQYIITSNILLDACAEAGPRIYRTLRKRRRLRCRHRHTGIAMP